MTTWSTRATKFTLGCAMLGLFFTAARTTHAQSNEAFAESLFHEGKRLYAEKNYAEACPKLAQSHQADPAGGTVLLLAMCYEQQGRTASAWVKYSEALSLARRDGRADREQKSREAMAALEPQLTYLTVSLEPEAKAQSDLKFILDGTAIPLLVDAKVPVDPGEHEIVVRAKDCQPWTHKVSAKDKGSTVIVTVPGLTPLPPEPVATTATPAAAPATPEPKPLVNQPPELERKSNASRSTAYVLGGLGIAAVGVGSYFALHAKSLDNKADKTCPDSTCDNRQAVSLSQDATSNAKIATWVMGGGAALMATAGAVLLFGGNSSPHATGSATQARIGATAVALPSGGAVVLMGRY